MFTVAHRVNSPAAAARLADGGAAVFELDVRLTRSRIVLSHYRKIGWAGGLLERDNARIRVGDGPPFDAPIDAVLAALPDDAVILFDPKDREPARRAELAALLARTVPDPGRHVVSSRDRRDLAAFGAAGFRTWLTLDTPRQAYALARAGLNGAGLNGAGPAGDGVSVRHRALSASVVRALHEVTPTVVAWTVNRVPRALELAGFGVDGVTTDSPLVMAALAP